MKAPDDMDADRFAEIQEGDEAEIRHQITEKDLDAFATLTGDSNPLHMDAAYAARTPLRKRVGHGMLTASFISTMIGTKLPGEGSLWYEQQLRFLRPVRIGEKIKVWAKVIHKSVGQRVVTLETNVYGEDGTKLIEGEAKVRMVEVNVQRPIMKTTESKGAVIVTGASRGIGAGIACALAARGRPVIVNCARSVDAATALVRSLRNTGGVAEVFQADVADAAAVREMVAFTRRSFGEIAGVVNNASPRIEPQDFEKLSWGAVQAQIDVQIKGAFHVCQEVLPAMIEKQDGSIVNIGSIYADNLPPVKLLAYTLAKSALASMTRCLAAEYGPKGIRVNCVSPGMAETDLTADVPEKVKLTTRMQTPLRRLATPEDVAGVVAFLLSAEARHVTGQNLRVCGGLVMA